MAHKILFFDYETFSLLDLKEVGLDNYSKHPSTGISCLAWALDEEEVELWLPHLGPPSQKLLDSLRNKSIIKIAWNSSFEWSITNRVFAPQWAPDLKLDLEEMRDPIVLARMLSMPGKLESVGAILNLKNQKDPRGDELKGMFCKPVKKGGEMTLFGIAPPLFRDHNTHPKEFEQYGEYCKQDVRSEREAWNRMNRIPFPEEQWVGWILDQRINWRGMPGRRDLAEKGLRLALQFITDQKKLLKEATGLENPNSDPQMKAWLKTRGYPWESMRAPTVAAELKNPNTQLTNEAKKALKLRSSARKSSYTKLERFLALLSDDERLRLQLSYMGASRTGRWKSGGKEEESASFQVQNMSRGEKAVKKKLDKALALIAAEDYQGIIDTFTNTENPKDSVTVVEVVISCLRSLFQARPGYRIVVADKNAIENRMLGWAAGCKAILDVFRTCDACGHLTENAPSPFQCEKCGGKKSRDPYLAFAVFMYKMTYEQLRDEYKAGVEDKRQNSKPPVLGAGYALGGGEMFYNEYGDEVRGGLWGYALAVCGVDMKKEDAHDAVKYFREAYPQVVQLWLDLEEAFKQVLLKGGVIKVGEVTWVKDHIENCDMDENTKRCHCRMKWMPHPTQGKQCVLTFRRIDMGNGKYSIRLELPSGRALHYLNATLDSEDKVSKKTGRPYVQHVLHYDGIEHSATQDSDGKNKKKHHKWGRVKTYGGKICLAGDTRVVTPQGIKELQNISTNDMVWDGVSWVNHDGLVDNGVQETKVWMGLAGTSDHLILGGSEWHELGKTTNLSGLSSLLTGLASVIRLLYSPNHTSTDDPEYDATADKYSILVPERCGETKSINVHLAGAVQEGKGEPNVSATTSSLTPSFGKCGSGSYQTFGPDVKTQSAPHTSTTADEELNAMSHGEKTEGYGSNMYSLSKDGIIRILNLIELTTTGIMNREISGSYLAQRIQTIVEALYGLVGEVKPCPTKFFVYDLLRTGVKTLSGIICCAVGQSLGASTDTKPQRVFDLKNCGERHRFLVLTDGGPVIVHNCENVVQAMSRDDLLNSMFLAEEMGFEIWGMFHDELACEVPNDGILRLEDLNWCMCQVPKWAPGFILGAEGYESPYYKKG